MFLPALKVPLSARKALFRKLREGDGRSSRLLVQAVDLKHLRILWCLSSETFLACHFFMSFQILMQLDLWLALRTWRQNDACGESAGALQLLLVML